MHIGLKIARTLVLVTYRRLSARHFADVVAPTMGADGEQLRESIGGRGGGGD